MKNKLILTALLFLFLSCNNQVNKEYGQYKNEQLAISIAYPNNWNLDSNTFKIIEDLTSTNDVFQEVVEVSQEKLPMSITTKDYANSVITSYRIVDSTIKVLKTDSFFVNKQLFYHVYFSNVNNNKSIHHSAYTSLKNLNAYLFHCVALDSSWQSHQPIFEKIVKSVILY